MRNLKTYKFAGGDPGKGNGDSSSGFPTAAVECPSGEAELISSEVDGIFEDHVVALDIDHPCHLIETSPGKHHLIIEKAVPFERVKEIMSAFNQAGIVESGYMDASITRGHTFLRIHLDTPLEVDV